MIEEWFLEDFRIQWTYWWKESVDNAIEKYSGSKEVDLDTFLDNQQQFWHQRATAGFLYFAKTPEIYATWKKRQDKHTLLKHYYAVVDGNIWNYFTYGSKNDDVFINNDTIVISRPLMHDKFDDGRMIAINESANMKKWRWKLQETESTIEMLEYNKEENSSLIHITITAWKRHQIRVHCASLWHPILGDELYSIHDKDWLLHLWSVGVDVL